MHLTISPIIEGLLFLFFLVGCERLVHCAPEPLSEICGGPKVKQHLQPECPTLTQVLEQTCNDRPGETGMPHSLCSIQMLNSCTVVQILNADIRYTFDSTGHLVRFVQLNFEVTCDTGIAMDDFGSDAACR